MCEEFIVDRSVCRGFVPHQEFLVLKAQKRAAERNTLSNKTGMTSTKSGGWASFPGLFKARKALGTRLQLADLVFDQDYTWSNTIYKSVEGKRH